MTLAGVSEAGAKLEKLIEHGRRNVWSPTHDVDWMAGSAELERLDGRERAALRSVLSLVYYSDSQGREILETLCRALDRGKKEGDAHNPLMSKARDFFEYQIGDEERHADGILQLFARLKLQPEERTLSHALYSKVLTSEGLFDAKLILIYWYIEVLAKGIFIELKKRFPETCVDGLFTRIIRDEARHVGFGEVFIPVHAARLGPIENAQLGLAYYSTAAALPALYRYTHYARAARVLRMDLSGMLAEGMSEIGAKVARLPQGTGLINLKRPAEWMSALL